MMFTSGKDNEKMHSGCIQYVITQDNKTYEFDGTPNIVNDSIVGKVNGKQMSIPLSDIAVVNVKKIDWPFTTLAVLTLGAFAVAMAYGVAISSLHW